MVFNRAKYLERIGVNAASLSPTVETLRLLQRSHLLAVPFENLDIHWHRPIVLDVDRFYSKVVGEGRGGFCYELNGLFNELLAAFGFSTRLISAGVFGADGVLGPEFDHAAIITTIDEDEFLVDVGFGDFTAEPLRFVVGETQYDRNGLFRIEKTEDSGFLVSKLTADRWKDQYIFKDTARELSEFAEMCDFQQYSPESTFTKRRVCSILTDGGRKTLSDKALSSRLATSGLRSRSLTRGNSTVALSENSEYSGQAPSKQKSSGLLREGRKKSTKRITFCKMYYMKYETTVTSKGTITIAAAIREALGLKPGKKVRLSLMANRLILLEPAITVDEFIEYRDELLNEVPPTPRLSESEVESLKAKAKSVEYKKRRESGDQSGHKRRTETAVR